MPHVCLRFQDLFVDVAESFTTFSSFSLGALDIMIVE